MAEHEAEGGGGGGWSPRQPLSTKGFKRYTHTAQVLHLQFDLLKEWHIKSGKGLEWG